MSFTGTKSFSYLVVDILVCLCVCSDATSEYVKARTPVTKDGISVHGLGCCTILIGAYDIACGQPIAGVISRPFASTASDQQPSDGTQ